LEKFDFRWVLHALAVNRRSERSSNSKLFLTAVMERKPIDFERVITMTKHGSSWANLVTRPGQRRVTMLFIESNKNYQIKSLVSIDWFVHKSTLFVVFCTIQRSSLTLIYRA
jgi:hypothetical protein